MNATKPKAGEGADRDDDVTLSDELELLRAQVARLAERLRGEEAAVIERARDLAGEIAGEWRRVEDDIADAARRRPWRSLGLAALAGFVLGVLWRR
jgi:ElaB/YqjD/DUF883 family membrane-anchored ribosome-binding protein